MLRSMPVSALEIIMDLVESDKSFSVVHQRYRRCMLPARRVEINCVEFFQNEQLAAHGFLSIHAGLELDDDCVPIVLCGGAVLLGGVSGARNPFPSKHSPLVRSSPKRPAIQKGYSR